MIATYLISGFRGELEGFVSVSRVQASQDLRAAKVFLSIMGTPEQQEASLEMLTENVRDVQDEVHHKLKLRYTPKLTFQIDHSLEKQLKVEGILRNLELERAAKGNKTQAPASSKDDETSDE